MLKMILVTMFCSMALLFAKNFRNKSDVSHSYTGIDKIDVDLSLLDIVVIGSDRNDVEVKLINIPKNIVMDIIKDENRLIISSNSDKKWFKFLPLPNSRVIIYIPNDLKLELNNIAGSIEVQDFSGIIRSKSTAGRQTYNNILGTITASSKAGNIVGEDVFFNGDSKFITTGGDININFNNNPDEISFDLEAIIGNIDFDNIDQGRTYNSTDGIYSINARSIFGDQVYSSI